MLKSLIVGQEEGAGPVLPAGVSPTSDHANEISLLCDLSLRPQSVCLITPWGGGFHSCGVSHIHPWLQVSASAHWRKQVNIHLTSGRMLAPHLGEIPGMISGSERAASNLSQGTAHRVRLRQARTR